MLYAPHILYKKVIGQIRTDSFGKPIAPKEEWVKVGVCRCDDDTTQELATENGRLYKSRYHVVYDRSNIIAEGDEIKCLNADGSVRGTGVVGRVQDTNYLRYSELWT